MHKTPKRSGMSPTVWNKETGDAGEEDHRRGSCFSTPPSEECSLLAFHFSQTSRASCIQGSSIVTARLDVLITTTGKGAKRLADCSYIDACVPVLLDDSLSGFASQTSNGFASDHFRFARPPRSPWFGVRRKRKREVECRLDMFVGYSCVVRIYLSRSLCSL